MSGDEQYSESESHSAAEEHPTGEQGSAGAGGHATSAGYGEEQSGFGTVQQAAGEGAGRPDRSDVDSDEHRGRAFGGDSDERTYGAQAGGAGSGLGVGQADEE